MIVKMKFVSLTGPTDDIDRIVSTYLSRYEIHLENALLEWNSSSNLKPYVEANPYKDMLQHSSELMSYISDKTPDSKTDINVDTANKIITDITDSIHHIQEDISCQEELLKNLQENYDNISPFVNLNYDISSIFSFRHIIYHFGKVPKNYYNQFEEYCDNTDSVINIRCSEDNSYIWCLYFTPAVRADVVDAACTSLHFEETFIPKDFSGTPEKSCMELLKQIDSAKNKIKELRQSITDNVQSKRNDIINSHNRITSAYENFDVRKMAAKTNADGTTFYIICGWMDEKDADSLAKDIECDENIIGIFEEAGSHRSQSPPTKLKNPRFFKPFEMFIEMYGLPSYYEFDPTIFVALTYCLIFGVMFGDVGQGLVLLIGGALLYKFKKMRLAYIISFAGFFSTIFGVLFGSVFGFENIIDALWLRPTEQMSDLPFIGSLNTVFVVAIAFGMFLILLSMIFHIINAVKSKNRGDALFDTNGVAGFVFYGAIVSVILLYMTGKPLPATIILVIMFVIPLLLIAFKEPLCHMLERKSKLIDGSIGMFFTQTFFEMFEVLLSYFSNTLSFVRIGAFAVSHAAMMQVVMMLSGAESNSPNWIVVILGNLIVMVMEGFIVGIQVLRLEYYEMFSRYYNGSGREFKPFRHVNTD